jgi:hypothetical protein
MGVALHMAVPEEWALAMNLRDNDKAKAQYR